MSRKPNVSDPAAADAALTLAPPVLPTITRAEANQLLKARAVELYHEAKARQQEGIARFEAEYGRADRIDASLLRELQHLQLRFAAIAARQQRHGYGQEPKVSRFVKSLGEILGDVTVHLATDQALELFASIEERDYVGYDGAVGRKGYDRSVLANYQVVEPVKATSTVAARDDDELVCLHDDVEPYEDDPAHGMCSQCGEEFELEADGALASSADPQDS
ncbi:MAG: hypothetical protein ACLPSH_10165 [Vulcanimicrobiaceae bacterium]